MMGTHKGIWHNIGQIGFYLPGQKEMQAFVYSAFPMQEGERRSFENGRIRFHQRLRFALFNFTP
jgi:hypothetical protein